MDNLKEFQHSIPQLEYKVLVRCLTYNQSQYIKDALNGFVMQQTNFPFVCIVMDDASTDGEQEVIKAWMELECDMSRAEYIDIPISIVIVVPHKTNTSCTFAFYLLKENLYRTGKKDYYLTPWREKCEYEALCEGDDYWIDPFKLQKQVDFLEKNLNYGLCYTKSKLFNQKTQKYLSDISSPYRGIMNMILYRNPIVTLTVLYRKDLYYSYINEINPNEKHWLTGDYPLWIWIGLHSKIHYIEETTAVYRYLENSASHSTGNIKKQEDFNRSIYDIRIFFLKKYFTEYSNYIQYLDDDYYRRNFINGIINNDRLYCIKNLKEIKAKTFRDVFFSLLFKSKILFYIYRLKNLK